MAIQLDGWDSPRAWLDAGESAPPLAELTEAERAAADEARVNWGLLMPNPPDGLELRAFAVTAMPEGVVDHTREYDDIAEMPTIAMAIGSMSGGWNIYARNGALPHRAWVKGEPGCVFTDMDDDGAFKIGGRHWLLKVNSLGDMPLKWQIYCLSAAFITLITDYPDLVSANNRIVDDDVQELIGELWPSHIRRADAKFGLQGAFANRALFGYPIGRLAAPDIERLDDDD